MTKRKAYIYSIIFLILFITSLAFFCLSLFYKKDYENIRSNLIPIIASLVALILSYKKYITYKN